MKYADIHEFKSQSKPAVPCVKSEVTSLETLKSTLKSLFKPSFDPTRLTKAERREAGILECEVDWYKALNGPLVK